MILNFIKYLYFLLLYIFVFLLISSNIFYNIDLGNNFIFLFSLLVIPVIDIVIEKIRLSVKVLLFVAILLFCYIYLFSLIGADELVEPLLKYAYIFLITGAVTQYASHILDFKNKDLSVSKVTNKRKKGLEDYFHIFYIGVGVLFLIGLFYEILKFVFHDYSFGKLAGVFLVFSLIFINSKKIKIDIRTFLKKHLKDINYKNFLKYRKKLNNNKLFNVMTGLNIRNDLVFYIIFAFFTSLFLYGFVLGLTSILILSYVFIFISYLAFKIYGFKIEASIEKKQMKSNSFLFVSIFFSSLFAISAFRLFDGYLLNDYKNLYLSGFILFFLALFSFVFSDLDFKSGTKTKRSKSNKNYYNIMTSITIIILSLLVIIKNLSQTKPEVIVIENNIETQKQTTTQTIETKTDSNGYEDESMDDGLNSAKEKLKLETVDETIEGANVESTGASLQESGNTKKIKIGDLYKFENYLGLYNESEDTKKLQEFMKMLGYFTGEVNGFYDGFTQEALKQILMYECHWPTTAKGLLGEKAAECIEGLEFEVEVE